MSAAKFVLSNLAFGRMNQWILSTLKWFNISQNYENYIQNSVYKIINSENDHDFKNYLTKNRNIRMQSDNKVGHHDQSMGHSQHTQKTFLYKAISIYNKLPRNITLIRSHHLFKKWCKLYNLNNKINIKAQDDNNIIIIQPIIDLDDIAICENN